MYVYANEPTFINLTLSDDSSSELPTITRSTYRPTLPLMTPLASPPTLTQQRSSISAAATSTPIAERNSGETSLDEQDTVDPVIDNSHPSRWTTSDSSVFIPTPLTETLSSASFTSSSSRSISAATETTLTTSPIVSDSREEASESSDLSTVEEATTHLSNSLSDSTTADRRWTPAVSDSVTSTSGDSNRSFESSTGTKANESSGTTETGTPPLLTVDWTPSASTTPASSRSYAGSTSSLPSTTNTQSLTVANITVTVPDTHLMTAASTTTTATVSAASTHHLSKRFRFVVTAVIGFIIYVASAVYS